ncbi:MAG: VOC family protein [Sedimentisphaerales bacterium]|nr:VOC family protein [Sedimentisphaerales bacterium]
MVIDHLGIVVTSIEDGIRHWEDVFGYRQMTEVVVNSRQNVKVVFLAKEQSITVKLIEPVDEASPAYRLAKRGGGLHHLCFKCENIDRELGQLTQKGLRVLSQPAPGEAFENENIAFIFAKQGLNIELIDTDKKAMRRF